MILHEYPEYLSEFVGATAKDKKIPETYVEKDYWITRSLRCLHESKHNESVVFKGGTSLSKVYGILERFSEDIDLALIQELSMGDAKRKKLIKAVEQTVSQGLSYISGHPLESKHGRFRKTAYAFPSESESVESEQAKNEILIEINSFANPEPAEMLPVGSLIGEFLEESAHMDLVEQFELDRFEILVLGAERTLCEKIMSLVRAEHEDQSKDEYRRRIRHFYDIVLILRQQKYRNFIRTSSFRKLLEEVRRCDRESFEEASKWLDPPMRNAKIFSGESEFWSDIERGLEAEIKGMLYGDELPEIAEVTGTFSLIRDSLF